MVVAKMPIEKCLTAKQAAAIKIKANPLSPEANPSIPSIRLMALMTYTKTKTVSGIPIQNGIAVIPNNPPKLFIHSPPTGGRMAAITCATNFVR